MLLNVEGFANLVKKVGKRDIEEGNGSDGNVGKRTVMVQGKGYELGVWTSGLTLNWPLGPFV